MRKEGALLRHRTRGSLVGFRYISKTAFSSNGYSWQYWCGSAAKEIILLIEEKYFEKTSVRQKYVISPKGMSAIIPPLELLPGDTPDEFE